MRATVNGCQLNVEVMGPEDGPALIAHHGSGGIGACPAAGRAPHMMLAVLEAG